MSSIVFAHPEAYVNIGRAAYWRQHMQYRQVVTFWLRTTYALPSRILSLRTDDDEAFSIELNAPRPTGEGETQVVPGSIRVRLRDAQGNILCGRFDTPFLNDDTWHLVAVESDPPMREVRFRVDGRAVTTTYERRDTLGPFAEAHAARNVYPSHDLIGACLGPSGVTQLYTGRLSDITVTVYPPSDAQGRRIHYWTADAASGRTVRDRGEFAAPSRRHPPLHLHCCNCSWDTVDVPPVCLTLRSDEGITAAVPALDADLLRRLLEERPEPIATRSNRVTSVASDILSQVALQAGRRGSYIDVANVDHNRRDGVGGVGLSLWLRSHVRDFQVILSLPAPSAAVHLVANYGEPGNLGVCVGNAVFLSSSDVCDGEWHHVEWFLDPTDGVAFMVDGSLSTWEQIPLPPPVAVAPAVVARPTSQNGGRLTLGVEEPGLSNRSFLTVSTASSDGGAEMEELARAMASSVLARVFEAEASNGPTAQQRPHVKLGSAFDGKLRQVELWLGRCTVSWRLTEGMGTSLPPASCTYSETSTSVTTAQELTQATTLQLEGRTAMWSKTLFPRCTALWTPGAPPATLRNIPVALDDSFEVSCFVMLQPGENGRLKSVGTLFHVFGVLHVELQGDRLLLSVPVFKGRRAVLTGSTTSSSSGPTTPMMRALDHRVQLYESLGSSDVEVRHFACDNTAWEDGRWHRVSVRVQCVGAADVNHLASPSGPMHDDTNVSSAEAASELLVSCSVDESRLHVVTAHGPACAASNPDGWRFGDADIETARAAVADMESQLTAEMTELGHRARDRSVFDATRAGSLFVPATLGGGFRGSFVLLSVLCGGTGRHVEPCEVTWTLDEGSGNRFVSTPLVPTLVPVRAGADSASPSATGSPALTGLPHPESLPHFRLCGNAGSPVGTKSVAGGAAKVGACVGPMPSFAGFPAPPQWLHTVVPSMALRLDGARSVISAVGFHDAFDPATFRSFGITIWFLDTGATRGGAPASPLQRQKSFANATRSSQNGRVECLVSIHSTRNPALDASAGIYLHTQFEHQRGIRRKVSHPTAISFVLCDSSERYLALECHVDIFDGIWHKLQWLVHDSRSNLATVLVDDRVVETSVVCAEGPFAFGGADMTLNVGARDEGDGGTQHHATGNIRAFGLFKGDADTEDARVVSWPLDEGRGILANDAGRRTVGAITQPHWEITSFPPLTPRFGTGSSAEVFPIDDLRLLTERTGVSFAFSLRMTSNKDGSVFAILNTQRHPVVSFHVNSVATAQGLTPEPGTHTVIISRVVEPDDADEGGSGGEVEEVEETDGEDVERSSAAGTDDMPSEGGSSEASALLKDDDDGGFGPPPAPSSLAPRSRLRLERWALEFRLESLLDGRWHLVQWELPSGDPSRSRVLVDNAEMALLHRCVTTTSSAPADDAGDSFSIRIPDVQDVARRTSTDYGLNRGASFVLSARFMQWSALALGRVGSVGSFHGAMKNFSLNRLQHLRPLLFLPLSGDVAWVDGLGNGTHRDVALSSLLWELAVPPAACMVLDEGRYVAFSGLSQLSLRSFEVKLRFSVTPISGSVVEAAGVLCRIGTRDNAASPLFEVILHETAQSVLEPGTVHVHLRDLDRRALDVDCPLSLELCDGRTHVLCVRVVDSRNNDVEIIVDDAKTRPRWGTCGNPARFGSLAEVSGTFGARSMAPYRGVTAAFTSMQISSGSSSGPRLRHVVAQVRNSVHALAPAAAAFTASVLARYECVGGYGTVLRDASGNRHHAVAVRPLWVSHDADGPVTGIRRVATVAVHARSVGPVEMSCSTSSSDSLGGASNLLSDAASGTVYCSRWANNDATHCARGPRDSVVMGAFKPRDQAGNGGWSSGRPAPQWIASEFRMLQDIQALQFTMPRAAAATFEIFLGMGRIGDEDDRVLATSWSGSVLLRAGLTKAATVKFVQGGHRSATVLFDLPYSNVRCVVITAVAGTAPVSLDALSIYGPMSDVELQRIRVVLQQHTGPAAAAAAAAAAAFATTSIDSAEGHEGDDIGPDPWGEERLLGAPTSEQRARGIYQLGGEGPVAVTHRFMRRGGREAVGAVPPSKELVAAERAAATGVGKASGWEARARAHFLALDAERRGYVSEPEVAALLLELDVVGIFTPARIRDAISFARRFDACRDHQHGRAEVPAITSPTLSPKTASSTTPRTTRANSHSVRDTSPVPPESIVTWAVFQAVYRQFATA